jgi:hypothetical protein
LVKIRIVDTEARDNKIARLIDITLLIFIIKTISY